MSDTIGENSRVTLHFAVLLDSGEEVDTTRRGQPAASLRMENAAPSLCQRTQVRNGVTGTRSPRAMTLTTRLLTS